MPGFVYILQGDIGRFYIGSTDRPAQRMAQHESGYTQTTRNMKNPWLVFQQEYPTLLKARQIEYRLKQLKRKDYIEKIIKEGYIRME